MDRARVDQALAVTDAAESLRSQAGRGERVAPACLGEAPVLVRQGARDRFAVAARTDREHLERRLVADDGRVPKAVDQLAPHARVHRGDEPEPEAGEASGEERHGDDHAAHAELSRVLAHQILVGDTVGSADLEHRVALELDIERLHEVVEHVLDRDRLRDGAHPARCGHHRQALDQLADHLERQAVRADHDRGPELDRLHARPSQQAAHLLAAGEVRRKIVTATQAAQVDQPPDARLACGGCEVLRGTPVLLLEAPARAHRVDQVVGRIDPAQRGS